MQYSPWLLIQPGEPTSLGFQMHQESTDSKIWRRTLVIGFATNLFHDSGHQSNDWKSQAIFPDAVTDRRSTLLTLGVSNKLGDTVHNIQISRKIGRHSSFPRYTENSEVFWSPLRSATHLRTQNWLSCTHKIDSLLHTALVGKKG